jgi:hypothetical protein
MTVSQIALVLTIAAIATATFSFGAVPKVTRVARILCASFAVLALIAHNI